MSRRFSSSSRTRESGRRRTSGLSRRPSGLSSYLHKDDLLSEHELWPDEIASSFVDSPQERGSVTFVTPPMVENTEVCGPMVLNLHASTTDTEVLWFVNFLEIDKSGSERVLTRGWLRGSQRRIDPEKSDRGSPITRMTSGNLLSRGKSTNLR